MALVSAFSMKSPKSPAVSEPYPVALPPVGNGDGCLEDGHPLVDADVLGEDFGVRVLAPEPEQAPFDVQVVLVAAAAAKLAHVRGRIESGRLAGAFLADAQPARFLI